MNDTVLRWVAGVAASLAVLAGGAAITTWADSREMKNDVKELREALASQVKAERIATLETKVEHLTERCEHRSLWEAIRRER